MKKQKTLLLTLSFVVISIVLAGKLFFAQETNLGIRNLIERGTFVPEVVSLSATPIPAKSIENIVIDFGSGKKVEAEVVAQTAYEALEKVAAEKDLAIEVKEYKYGVMVTKIGDRENNNQYAWVYSINGKPGQIASDRYVVYPGDKIEWKYEKFK